MRDVRAEANTVIVRNISTMYPTVQRIMLDDTNKTQEIAMRRKVCTKTVYIP